MGARILSECYSDLVLRMPWYVAWPLLIAFGALALHFVAVRSMYFPVRHPERFWSLQAHLRATDVWLDSTDHVRIHGWFVAFPGSRRVTLFLHGNAGNITHRGQRFCEIAAAGSSVLMIDYRGYGKRTGRPSENGLYADAAQSSPTAGTRGGAISMLRTALSVCARLLSTWIRRILASREAAKRCVDRLGVHVVEFHQFLTIG